MSRHSSRLDQLREICLRAVPACSPPAGATKQALGFGVLAIVALVCTACRTPLPRQTLEVGQLEVGMKREAVRALMGEPDWVEEGTTPEAVRALMGEPVEAERSFPASWPGLLATET